MKWKIVLGVVFSIIYLISAIFSLYIVSLPSSANISQDCSDVVYDGTSTSSGGRTFHYENLDESCYFLRKYVFRVTVVIAVLPFFILMVMGVAMSGYISDSYMTVAYIVGGLLNLVTYFFIGFGIGSWYDKKKAGK